MTESQAQALRAENEALKAKLMNATQSALNHVQRVRDLEDAVNLLWAARGRYHTQLATCNLFDLCGLKNERPTK